jgi:hypothetical protein
MATRKQGSKAEKDLTERQRHWLRHLRAAECTGEPMKMYAERLGLSEHSMYEAKRHLRVLGVIAPAASRKTTPPRFTRVTVAPRASAPVASLRVRLSSGAVLEWSEAPQGDALRELVGLVS